MSRQERNIRKPSLPGLSAPSLTPKGGVIEHYCEACGRWGSYGRVRRDVNGISALDNGIDWFCQDHLPEGFGDSWGHRPTWNAKFERAWFECKKAKAASGG